MTVCVRKSQDNESKKDGFDFTMIEDLNSDIQILFSLNVKFIWIIYFQVKILQKSKVK